MPCQSGFLEAPLVRQADGELKNLQFGAKSIIFDNFSKANSIFSYLGDEKVYKDNQKHYVDIRHLSQLFILQTWDLGFFL